LVVDCDGDVRQIVADLLIDLGHVVTLARDGATMRAILDAIGIDLIVLDASTSDTDALTLATVARERGIRLVMISGHPAIMKAYRDRADQLLWKPFAGDALKRAIEHALLQAIRTASATKTRISAPASKLGRFDAASCAQDRL
jgi:DNA-binding NtrC family response regulator